MPALEGGAPIPVTTGGSGQTEGRRAAVPVYVVSGAGPVVGQKARRVVVVTDGPVEGGAAHPVYDAGANAVYSTEPALPVFVVSGSLGSGANPNAYALLRDQFTDTDPAPLTTPRVAVPGRGKWLITDTTTPKVLSTDGKRLNTNQAGVAIGTNVDMGWGTTALVGVQDDGVSGFARVQGRAFAAVLDVEDQVSTFAIHWATSSTPGNPAANGHGWLMDDNAAASHEGWLQVISNALLTTISGTTSLISTIRPMQYLAVIVLQASGAYVLLSTFATDTGGQGNSDDPIGIPAYPLARLVWAERSGTTTPMFPCLNFRAIFNYPGGHNGEEAWLWDLTTAAWTTQNNLATARDTFTRADSALLLGTADVGGAWAVDGAGVWGISSNQAYVASASGFPRAYLANALPSGGDGVVECDITAPNPTTAGFGLMVRRQDANNYIRVWNNGGNFITIQTFVAGAFGATIVNLGFSWVVGQTYRLRVAMSGNKYQVWIDGVNMYGSWQADSNSRFITSRDCGLYANNSAGIGTARWDNFMVWPHTVTLPAELQASGAAALLTAWTPGSVIASDTFTQANNTRLNSYTPPAGGVWTENAGTWTVQSNKATASLAVSQQGTVTQNLSVTDAECSIDITMPGVLGTYVFAGIVARYVDANNWIAFRFAADTVLQPNQHEIEIMQMIAGVPNVVHKVQFGVAFPAASTHTLKVQVLGERARIFFDGEPRESWVLPAVLASGTRFGIYRNGDDGGAVFDTWSVKALT